MDINATIIAIIKNKIKKLEESMSTNKGNTITYSYVKGQIKAYINVLNLLKEVNVE
ncbi:MAG: hypothetical protein H8D97_00380 [Proteobacteria bacterium]|nr:hypothetical protein [Pseudomonadota bacterium]